MGLWPNVRGTLLMKIPFSDKEKLIVKADKDRLIQTLSDHIHSEGKAFETMFTGQVNDSSFKLNRSKKFGLMDYSVTVIKGQIKKKNGIIEFDIAYHLMWWYAGQILAEIVFFTLFAILTAVKSDSELRDISLIALIGLPIITFTTIRYKRRYEGDKVKYKSMLDGLVYKSNVR
jgi:hypothetical protein